MCTHSNLTTFIYLYVYLSALNVQRHKCVPTVKNDTVYSILLLSCKLQAVKMHVSLLLVLSCPVCRDTSSDTTFTPAPTPTHTHTHTHSPPHSYTHPPTHACTHTRTHARIHTPMHARSHTRAQQDTCRRSSIDRWIDTGTAHRESTQTDTGSATDRYAPCWREP